MANHSSNSLEMPLRLSVFSNVLPQVICGQPTGSECATQLVSASELQTLSRLLIPWFLSPGCFFPSGHVGNWEFSAARTLPAPKNDLAYQKYDTHTTQKSYPRGVQFYFILNFFKIHLCFVFKLSFLDTLVGRCVLVENRTANTEHPQRPTRTSQAPRGFSFLRLEELNLVRHNPNSPKMWKPNSQIIPVLSLVPDRVIPQH